ncbi:MAG TPA: T9SS type A sorting domain-containing protein [Candidatus Cloacimonadota bacterium]|nr:T9SS type A sorting domain-containing protein [Candidatus Cloacimonadota bacterium]HPM01775.1 T9SS type A sorting domain-containing protein [Candidatus Cloacimonadota bacterium]
MDYQIHKELNNDILQEYIRYRYNYTTANDNQVIAPSTISISAYPNPFNGNTNITVKSNDKQVKVQLYNIKGRLIAEENMNLNRSNNVNFNTEHLSSGIYFVKVKSATESKTCKIMKIK